MSFEQKVRKDVMWSKGVAATVDELRQMGVALIDAFDEISEEYNIPSSVVEEAHELHGKGL